MRIINCARGGLVVEEDLKAALDSGHVAGAALDVFPVEPAKENILFGREDVIATPHLGASTTEAQENVALQIAEQMSDFLVTGAVVNALNMPSLSAEDAARLRPYLKLAEQLGSFAGQLVEADLEGVEIEYCGHAAELNVKPLTAIGAHRAARAAARYRQHGERAGHLPRARHPRQRDALHRDVRLPHAGAGHASRTQRRTRSIAGTLFGGDRPRIVGIEDIAMEAELGPAYAVSCATRTSPASSAISAARWARPGSTSRRFHLGRSAPGDDALCLVQVDQPLARCASRTRAPDPQRRPGEAAPLLGDRRGRWNAAPLRAHRAASAILAAANESRRRRRLGHMRRQGHERCDARGFGARRFRLGRIGGVGAGGNDVVHRAALGRGAGAAGRPPRAPARPISPMTRRPAS